MTGPETQQTPGHEPLEPATGRNDTGSRLRAETPCHVTQVGDPLRHRGKRICADMGGSRSFRSRVDQPTTHYGRDTARRALWDGAHRGHQHRVGSSHLPPTITTHAEGVADPWPCTNTAPASGCPDSSRGADRVGNGLRRRRWLLGEVYNRPCVPPLAHMCRYALPRDSGGTTHIAGYWLPAMSSWA